MELAPNERGIQGVCGTGSVAAVGASRADRTAAAATGEGEPPEELRADPFLPANSAERDACGACGAGSQRGTWRGPLPRQDYLLAQYHYLGRPGLVGEHLKQLVFIGDQVVGCLGWASAAWKIAARGLPACWQRRYGHAVHLAETFVDSSRFAGTC
ncbi:MAG: hypothetical protein ACRERU_14970 [Methylococcales bacterium]